MKKLAMIAAFSLPSLFCLPSFSHAHNIGPYPLAVILNTRGVYTYFHRQKLHRMNCTLLYSKNKSTPQSVIQMSDYVNDIPITRFGKIRTYGFDNYIDAVLPEYSFKGYALLCKDKLGEKIAFCPNITSYVDLSFCTIY